MSPLSPPLPLTHTLNPPISPSDETTVTQPPTTQPTGKPSGVPAVTRRSTRERGQDRYNPPPPKTTRKKQPEEKESGTTGEQKESKRPTMYVIDGIRSARKVRGEDGVERWEYECQWEGCPNEQNSWKYRYELPQTTIMKKWTRRAQEGQSAGREATANREQVNCVYAILGETSTMNLSLSHDRTLTREDLLWESVYDSVQEPTNLTAPMIHARQNDSQITSVQTLCGSSATHGHVRWSLYTVVH